MSLDTTRRRKTTRRATPRRYLRGPRHAVRSSPRPVTSSPRAATTRAAPPRPPPRDDAPRDERQKAVRQAALRWHPDKFAQAYGRFLRADDRARVLERVNLVAQRVNRLKERLGE